MKINFNIAVLVALCLVGSSVSAHKDTKTVKMVNKYKLDQKLETQVEQAKKAAGVNDKKVAEKAALEKELEKLTDQQKVDLYPNLFYWEHEVDQEDVNKQNAANEKAASLFKSNPDGLDEHKEIKDGALSVQVSFAGKEEKMEEVHMYLNDEALYFLDDKTSGYRGVMASMQIGDIYEPSMDEVKMGQCCENVGIVSTKQIGDMNSQTTYHCFSVEDTQENDPKGLNKQDWKVCALDMPTAEEWRQAIILQVIIKGLKTKGIYGLDALLKFQKAACKNPRGWSYTFQSRWPCICPEGELQSPIDIETKDLKDQKTPQLSFHYQVTSSVVLNILPWQTNANADYGQMIYKNKKRKRTVWNAQEVRFKFPSEHKIDGKAFPGEMQIYHQNDNNRMALSIFISDNDKDLSTTKIVAKEEEKEKKDSKKQFNSDMGLQGLLDQKGGKSDLQKIIQENDAFLEQFGINMWSRRDLTIYDTQKCIDTAVNITKILDNDSVSNSWYMYMGSDTEPPCTEDVEWFIMSNPLIISSTVLNRIMSATLGNIENKNNRVTFPLMDREVIYHEQCKKFTIPVDTPVTIPNAQYVQAETTQHVYGIVHPQTKTIFDDDDKAIELTKGDNWKVTVEQMEEKELQKTKPAIVESLRSQLGNWLVENQGRIQKDKARKKKIADENAKIEAENAKNA